VLKKVEMISRSDREKNEERRGVKEKRTSLLQKKKKRRRRRRNNSWIGLILLRNTLLKERLKGPEEEEDGVSS
jgi:hypothetical protein